MAMAKLVSAYGDNAGEDSHDRDPVVKPENREAKKQQVSEWVECMDVNSGYPYYWNTKTNEVSWEKPAILTTTPLPRTKTVNSNSSSMPHARDSLSQRKLQATSSSQSQSTTRSAQKRSRSRSPDSSKAKKKPTYNAPKKKKEVVFFGPALPEPKPEEIAKQKIEKFETELTKSIVQQIETEVPLDWHNNMPRAISTKPFKWDKTEKLLPAWKASVTGTKESSPSATGSSSIALIAGAYGDTDSEDEEPPGEVGDGGTDKKMKLKIGSSSVKRLSVPAVFREDDDIAGTENANGKPKAASEAEGMHYNRKGKKIYSASAGQFKKSIDDVAGTLCEKLEALGVASIDISPLKLLAVQVETLFEAWQSSALSSAYLQKQLNEFSGQMSQLEAEVIAPKNWRASWDRSLKKYRYENLETGENRLEPPSRSTQESHDITEEPEQKSQDDRATSGSPPQSSAKGASPPPLPDGAPPPLPLTPPPPPPPDIGPMNSGGVQDMDIDDEEDEDDSSGRIVQEANQNISDTLESFYASLGDDLTNTASVPPSRGSTPDASGSVIQRPSPSAVASPSPSEEGNQSPSQFVAAVEDEKKKKKAKFSTALSMKKKGVDSLVAKWQTIQQEVNKNH